MAVWTTRDKGLGDDVKYPFAKRSAAGSKITRVLSPQSAEPCLHRIAGGYACEAHAVALAKTSPRSVVLPGPIGCSAQARAHKTSPGAFGTDCSTCPPFKTLASGDGLISAIAQDRHRLDLGCLTRCENASGDKGAGELTSNQSRARDHCYLAPNV